MTAPRFSFALGAFAILALVSFVALTDRDAAKAPASPNDLEYLVAFTEQATIGSLEVETRFEGIVALFQNKGKTTILVREVKEGFYHVRSEAQTQERRLEIAGDSAELDRVTGEVRFGSATGEFNEVLRSLVLQPPGQVELPMGLEDTYSPLGRVRVSVTGQDRGWRRRTTELLVPVGQGDAASGEWEATGELLVDASARPRFEGHASFERSTAAGALDKRISWRWVPSGQGSTRPRLRARSHPLEAVVAAPESLERAKKSAWSSAAGTMSWPTLVDFVTTPPSGRGTALEHERMFQAAAYLQLHPEEMRRLKAPFEAILKDRRDASTILALLGTVGGPEAQAVYWDLVEEAEARVPPKTFGQWLVVAGMFQAPTPLTFEKLSELRTSLSPIVRAHARLALGAAVSFRPDSPEAKAAVAHLEAEFRTDLDDMERESIVSAMGNAAAQSSLPLIEKAARSSSWRVRGRAASALRKYGPKEAQPLLAELTTDDDPSVQHAAWTQMVRHLGSHDRQLLDPVSRDLTEQVLTGGAPSQTYASVIRVMSRAEPSDRKSVYDYLMRQSSLGQALRAKITRIMGEAQ